VKALLDGLPAGQEIFYRVTAAGLSAPTMKGEPFPHRTGRPPFDLFRLVGRHGRPGLAHRRVARRHAHLRNDAQLRPDFLLHSGDTIYADGPIEAEKKLKDGTVWKNLVTEDKAKVAETIDEFRGNYKYNLLDRNVRAFNAEVPMLAQWDDHEVTNNWSPSKSLLEDKRYTVKSVPLLSARAPALSTSCRRRRANAWRRPEFALGVFLRFSYVAA
jgi:alkaline phosphatase D